MTDATALFFYSHQEPTSTVTFTLLNYNNDRASFLLVVIKTQSKISEQKNAMNKKSVPLYCVCVFNNKCVS